MRLENGMKVMVTEESARNGTGYDMALAKRIIGRRFTVRNIHVADWATEIELEEIIGLYNSVNFVEVE